MSWGGLAKRRSDPGFRADGLVGRCGETDVADGTTKVRLLVKYRVLGARRVTADEGH